MYSVIYVSNTLFYVWLMKLRELSNFDWWYYPLKEFMMYVLLYTNTNSCTSSIFYLIAIPPHWNRWKLVDHLKWGVNKLSRDTGSLLLNLTLSLSPFLLSPFTITFPPIIFYLSTCVFYSSNNVTHSLTASFQQKMPFDFYTTHSHCFGDL